MNKELVKNVPDFYKKYVEIVEHKQLIDALERNMHTMLSFWGHLAPEKEDHRYAPNKWSPKEILGHLIDTERIMAYRALRFARNDQSELPGFEQDDYVLNGDASQRTLANLITEFMFVRQSSIALFKTFDEAIFQRSGVASQAIMSVGALGFIIVGHGLHHIKVLEEKYLKEV